MRHQRVDIRSIRLVRGNSASGRMRMKEETFLLQIAHRVANRRRRNSQAASLGQGSRPCGLGGFDVCADHSLEDHTSELQSRLQLVSRLLLDKKKLIEWEG